MIIHGYDILACPYCSQEYKKLIILSSNTFGAAKYSDGHLTGPFMVQMPSMIRCINKVCGKFIHINELKEITSVDEFYEGTEYDATYSISSYSFGIEDLKEILMTNLYKDEEQEIIYRKQLLRRFNDFYRDGKEYLFSPEENNLYISNIDRLIELLKHETEIKEKLFITELYREKGDFNSCIKVLNGIIPETEDEKSIKGKIYSQAKIKDDKVFNIDNIAIKKEYKCNNCNDSMILFDLEELKENVFDFRHFICKVDNKVFNAPLKKRNPAKYYKLNRLQILLKLKRPYEPSVDNDKIACPVCNKKDVELFDPELQKCIKCGTGNYVAVKWFV